MSERIYNVPWTSYKEIGIQVQGRSKLLKKPYRTHPTHMDFALGFLAKDEVLAKDITNFYELESVSHELALGSYVELQSGSQDMVKKYLHDLLFVHDVNPSFWFFSTINISAAL